MKYENNLTFEQAAKHYRAVFKSAAGEPDEKQSVLKAGIWRLVDAQGAGLAWIYHDKSIMSGRIMQQMHLKP